MWNCCRCMVLCLGSNFDPSLCKLICKEDDIISYHINLWYQLIAIYENRLM